MIPSLDKGSCKPGASGPVKVLVSACLMGKPVRYNGSAKTLTHPLLERLTAEGRLVTVCPELSAGFSIPRPAAEIADGCDGDDVLAGIAKVVEATVGDVTGLYIAGAHATLKVAVENGCQFALLIDGSPSCGSGFVYDGSFTGKRRAGSGVAAALLRQHGIEVFADGQIEALERRLTSLLPHR